MAMTEVLKEETNKPHKETYENTENGRKLIKQLKAGK